MRMYKSLDSSVMDAVWAKRIHPNSVFVLSYSPGIDYPSIYQSVAPGGFIFVDEVAGALVVILQFPCSFGKLLPKGGRDDVLLPFNKLKKEERKVLDFLESRQMKISWPHQYVLHKGENLFDHMLVFAEDNVFDRRSI